MGLDWCLNDKVVAGMENEHRACTEVLESLTKQGTELYKSWLKENGHESPMMFPNDITEEYHKTAQFLDHDKLVQEKSAELGKYAISPMETMGAPRVGYDERATEYARNNYTTEVASDSEWAKKLLKQFPTVEDYLADAHGRWVSELAENKGGLAPISGMFVGNESFRGKIVGLIDWVPEDLKNKAYSDMEPEELLAYGKELIEAAAEFEQSIKDEGLGETEQNNVEIKEIRQAGEWCIFWGESGHAMRPWY